MFFLFIVFVFAMLSCLFLAGLWSLVGERADLLALLYVMFSCVFVTFPYGILGQVWYLIVYFPDFCLLPYFLFNGIIRFTSPSHYST